MEHSDPGHLAEPSLVVDCLGHLELHHFTTFVADIVAAARIVAVASAVDSKYYIVLVGLGAGFGGCIFGFCS
jgi:hypothetical protein